MQKESGCNSGGQIQEIEKAGGKGRESASTSPVVLSNFSAMVAPMIRSRGNGKLWR